MLPTNGVLGELFISIYNPRCGFLDRELIPFTLVADSKRHKNHGDIRVIERQQYGNRPVSLRKVQVRAPRRKSLEQICTAVDEEYVKKTSRCLLGAQLVVVNEKSEHWVSPWARNFLNFDLDEIEKNEKKLEEMRNNGEDARVIRFYESLEEMQLTDIWLKTRVRSLATCLLVKGEAKTFMNGFERL